MPTRSTAVKPENLRQVKEEIIVLLKAAGHKIRGEKRFFVACNESSLEWFLTTEQGNVILGVSLFLDEGPAFLVLITRKDQAPLESERLRTTGVLKKELDGFIKSYDPAKNPGVDMQIGDVSKNYNYLN